MHPDALNMGLVWIKYLKLLHILSSLFDKYRFRQQILTNINPISFGTGEIAKQSGNNFFYIISVRYIMSYNTLNKNKCSF